MSPLENHNLKKFLSQMGGKCSVQVTIKELASNKTFVMGDESMNLKVLKHRDLKRRANQLDWVPEQALIPES